MFFVEFIIPAAVIKANVTKSQNKMHYYTFDDENTS